MQQLPASAANAASGSRCSNFSTPLFLTASRPHLVRMDTHNDAAVQEGCKRQLRVSDVCGPHFRGTTHSLLCHVCSRAVCVCPASSVLMAALHSIENSLADRLAMTPCTSVAQSCCKTFASSLFMRSWSLCEPSKGYACVPTAQQHAAAASQTHCLGLDYVCPSDAQPMPHVAQRRVRGGTGLTCWLQALGVDTSTQNKWEGTS